MSHNNSVTLALSRMPVYMATKHTTESAKATPLAAQSLMETKKRRYSDAATNPDATSSGPLIMNCHR